MSNKNSIVAIGWYGAGNVGDEYLLQLLKDWAGLQGVEVTAISYDCEHTRTTHGIAAVDILDTVGIADALRRSCMLVMGGGSLLQTHDAFSIAGLFDAQKLEISAYVRPVYLAKQLGIPVMVWAHGVGPLHTEDSRAIAADIFRFIKYVSVRDSFSAKLVRELGYQGEILEAPDPVCSLGLQKAGSVNPSAERVAVVLRPWSAHPLWQRHFKDALRAVLPKGTELVWIAFQGRDVPGRVQSDRILLQDLFNELARDYRCEWAEYSHWQEVRPLLANCSAAIVMRLHAQILAALAGKPMLSIVYDEKMMHLANQMHIPDALRVRIDATYLDWHEAMTYWHGQAKTGVPSVNAQQLARMSDEALKHEKWLVQCLRLELEERDQHSWHADGIDWIGVWRDQQQQQIIDQLSNQISETKSAHRALEIEHLALKQQHQELDHASKRLTDQLQHAEGRAVWFQNQLSAVYQSWSWRITRPLRFCELLKNSPRQAVYRVLKAVYWRAPGVIRHRLSGLRTSFLRAYWAELKNIQTVDAGDSRDLSWDVFRSGPLSQRADYKGIFIQEVVIDWSVPLYQRPQHMAVAMAKLGYLVIYRTSNFLYDRVNGFREVLPNVWVSNSPQVDAIEGAIHSVYSTVYADIQYLKKSRKNSFLIYEYIDHIDPEISGDPDNIKRLSSLKTQAFSGHVDMIVASARKLNEEVKVGAPSVPRALIANGVDTAHYRNPIHAQHTVPQSLKAFKQRYECIVGYFGAIAPWLWYDVMNELFRQRSDIGFVFIGPDYMGAETLLKPSANLLRLGAVDYAVLPAYAKQFDVCLIPFKPGDIAQSTSPLKLFEYFALEKPVVVTSDMNECTAFHEVFHGHNVDSLSAAIDQARSAACDPVFKERLARLADDNDWLRRAMALEAAIQQLPQSPLASKPPT
jgi:polysaccharide pyruvyl transferase CsaB